MPTRWRSGSLRSSRPVCSPRALKARASRKPPDPQLPTPAKEIAMLAFILACLAAFLVLGFFGAPVIAWSAAGGVLLAWLAKLAGFGAAGDWALAVAFGALALIANVPALRRAVLSNNVLGIFRRILPDM